MIPLKKPGAGIKTEKKHLKGEIPVGFIVLKAGMIKRESEIVQKLVPLVRDRIGPIATFKLAAVVKRLPKTRSGKILRGTMKKIADGEPYTLPPTIDDPAILDEIRESLAGLGHPKARGEEQEVIGHGNILPRRRSDQEHLPARNSGNHTPPGPPSPPEGFQRSVKLYKDCPAKIKYFRLISTDWVKIILNNDIITSLLKII